jgi:hypothetical protein
MTGQDIVFGLGLAALSVCCLVLGAIAGWLIETGKHAEADRHPDEL